MLRDNPAGRALLRRRLLTWLYQPQRVGESRIEVVQRRNVGHVFRLCLLTASRIGEISKVRWDQIDQRRGVFEVVGTKNEFS